MPSWGLRFSENAIKDLTFWAKTNPKKYSKCKQIFEHILTDPFTGIAKPEPLRHQLSGCWSRRLDKQHRIVYKVENKVITIIACRYHY